MKHKLFLHRIVDDAISAGCSCGWDGPKHVIWANAFATSEDVAKTAAIEDGTEHLCDND